MQSNHKNVHRKHQYPSNISSKSVLLSNTARLKILEKDSAMLSTVTSMNTLCGIDLHVMTTVVYNRHQPCLVLIHSQNSRLIPKFTIPASWDLAFSLEKPAIILV
jgi:hypothetical protein